MRFANGPKPKLFLFEVFDFSLLKYPAQESQSESPSLGPTSVPELFLFEVLDFTLLKCRAQESHRGPRSISGRGGGGFIEILFKPKRKR